MSIRLEDTQVHSSNDSGLPEDKSSSSKSSSVASSTSTCSNGSPRAPENNDLNSSKTKAIPHSSSASALSSIGDKNRMDRNSFKRSSMDSSVLGKNSGNVKRNTNFTNVRENTGFLKTDSKGTPGSSSQNNRKNGPSGVQQGGIRRSVDKGLPDNTSPGSSNAPRLSSSRDTAASGKVTAQSAKLRIIAKDNANIQNKSSAKEKKGIVSTKIVLSSNKDSKTVGETERPKTVLGEIPEKDNEPGKLSSVTHVTAPTPKTGGPSSNNVKVGQSSAESKKVNSKLQQQQQQPQVLQLKAAVASSSKAGNTPAGKTQADESGTNSGNSAKVIQVQEAKGNGASSAVNSPKTAIRNSVSDNRSGSSYSRPLNSNAKPKVQPNVSKRSPLVSGTNRSPNIRHNSSVASSGKPNTSAVSISGGSKTNTSAVNKSTGVVSKPFSTAVTESLKSPVSSQVSVQTVVTSPTRTSSSLVQTTITSSSAATRTVGSTQGATVNKLAGNGGTTLTVNRQSSTTVNRQACSGSTTSTSTTFNTQSSTSTTVNRQSSTTVSRQTAGTKSPAVSRQPTATTVKIQPTSGVKLGNSKSNSGQQVGKDTSSDSTNAGESDGKSKTVTTTMTFSLHKTLNETSEDNTFSNVQLFNQGDTPVAPPRRKRSSVEGRSSSDSGEQGVETKTTSDGSTQGRNTVVTEMSVHTLKHGMTPLSTMNANNKWQNISGDSEVKNETGSGGKPIEVQANKMKAFEQQQQHEGPKIVDPFESLNERRRKEFAEMLAREKELAEQKQQQPPKSAKGKPNVAGKKNDLKSKSERQGSAGRNKRSRQKQTVTATTDDSKKRPRSSKKKRKGKKKLENDDDSQLFENAQRSNVALIGGIGWHIQTDCDDKSDVVQAVNLLNSDVSDDDEEINITVVPDYKGGDNQTGRKGKNPRREVTITVSGTLPGQITGITDSDHDDEQDSEESDFEDIPECAELVREEMAYVFGEGLSEKPITRVGGRGRVDDYEEKLTHPQTDTALKHFDENVSESDLNHLLGTKFPDIFKKTVSDENVNDKKKVKPPVRKSVQRNNSMPTSQKHPTVQSSMRKRNPSVGETENIDPEVEQMIDEIFKNTPNPSLSLSLGSSATRRKTEAKPSKSMTREEFEDAINQDGGMSFREVVTSSAEINKAKALKLVSAGGDDHIARLIRNRSQAELKELMEWKNKIDDLNEQEQEQLNKLMNTVKNLNLKVGPATDSTGSAEKSAHRVLAEDLAMVEEEMSRDYVGAKPPAGPSSGKASDKHALDKSPRFIRKKETLKMSTVEKVQVLMKIMFVSDIHIFFLF